MGKADLHTHSCHDAWGDGNQRVEDLFRWVEERTDLDLFAITDHDSTAAARAASDLHRRGGYRFGFLPGVEVTNQAGHLLCYFPSGDIHDIPSLRPFWWTVRHAQECGAICVAAHAIYPPWFASVLQRGLNRGLRLDGIESVNAGVSEKAQWRLSSVAAGFAPSVALVGNSDAHDQSGIQAAYTEFPGSTIEHFLAALRSHQTAPVFVSRPQMPAPARRFTTRRSMTRPGWVRNIWREIRASSR